MPSRKNLNKYKNIWSKLEEYIKATIPGSFKRGYKFTCIEEEEDFFIVINVPWKSLKKDIKNYILNTLFAEVGAEWDVEFERIRIPKSEEERSELRAENRRKLEEKKKEEMKESLKKKVIKLLEEKGAISLDEFYNDIISHSNLSGEVLQELEKEEKIIVDVLNNRILNAEKEVYTEEDYKRIKQEIISEGSVPRWIRKKLDIAIVGEDENKTLLQLVSYSRQMEETHSAILMGPSSVGKSYMEKNLRRAIDQEDVVYSTRITSSAPNYLPDVKHKLLMVEEMVGAEDTKGQLRISISEQELVLLTVEKGEGGRNELRVIRVEGPLSVISSTTRIEIDDQLLTRTWHIYPDTSPEQTRKIKEFEALLAKEPWRKKEIEKALRDLRIFDRLLKEYGVKKVVIPYSDHLVDLLPDEKVSVRRHFQKFLNLVKVVAFVNQILPNRFVVEIDGEDYVVAQPEDFKEAWEIGGKILLRTIEVLPPWADEVLKVCKQITSDEEPITSKEVAKRMGISQRTARRYLNRLVELGRLYVEQEGGKGKFKIYSLPEEESEGGEKEEDSAVSCGQTVINFSVLQKEVEDFLNGKCGHGQVGKPRPTPLSLLFEQKTHVPPCPRPHYEKEGEINSSVEKEGVSAVCPQETVIDLSVSQKEEKSMICEKSEKITFTQPLGEVEELGESIPAPDHQITSGEGSRITTSPTEPTAVSDPHKVIGKRVCGNCIYYNPEFMYCRKLIRHLVSPNDLKARICPNFTPRSQEVEKWRNRRNGEESITPRDRLNDETDEMMKSVELQSYRPTELQNYKSTGIQSGKSVEISAEPTTTSEFPPEIERKLALVRKDISEMMLAKYGDEIKEMAQRIYYTYVGHGSPSGEEPTPTAVTSHNTCKKGGEKYACSGCAHFDNGRCKVYSHLSSEALKASWFPETCPSFKPRGGEESG